MKTCTKCEKILPIAQFHKKTKAKDGLNPSCRKCVSAKMSEYYQSNKEECRERSAKWTASNTDRVKENGRKWYQVQAEKVKDSARDWSSKNREKRREINRKYAAANREKIRAKNLAYIERLKKESPAVLREQARRAQALRRAREKSAGGFISQENWNAIIGVFETGVCLYCGTYGHKLTMDHWVPVSRGGGTEAGNLIPCCKSCNSKKRDMPPEDWCAQKGIERVGIEEILLITKEALMAVHGIDVEVVK